ncbi:MAG: hypothetical protein ACXAEX_15875 [Promethearchaeota archaeon]|jgi:hypothetical protein
MSSVISWIKKELVYIKNSFFDIIKGFIFFVLASSGLGIAIFLRYLGYNGTVITFFGLIVEFIALLLCYFLFRRYSKTKEELEKPSTKEKAT